MYLHKPTGIKFCGTSFGLILTPLEMIALVYLMDIPSGEWNILSMQPALFITFFFLVFFIGNYLNYVF